MSYCTIQGDYKIYFPDKRDFRPDLGEAGSQKNIAGGV
jgi:hypothetical protein